MQVVENYSLQSQHGETDVRTYWSRQREEEGH